MKLAVALCAAIAALVLPNATASTGGLVDIRATVITVRVSVDGGRRSYFLRLWERDGNNPIGTAFSSCLVVGIDDSGKREWGCNAAYKLPLGQLVASGVSTSLNRLPLAITGGTRLYIGQGGVSFTYRIGPGTYRVLMRLVP